MSDLNEEQGTPQLTRLLRDLSIELKSRDLEEMRVMLLAFNGIDEVLGSLREEIGIQVYRGTDVVEEYRRSREAREKLVAQYALDYIVRKANVELQLEVRLGPSNGFCLGRDSLERYHRILAANSKTEEVIVVWATEELRSIALSLADVQSYVSHLEQKGEPIRIAEEKVSTLRETVLAALERHRPIFHKLPITPEIRKIEFDVVGRFAKILEAKFHELKESAERKIARERILAIQSLSESDKELIQTLFSDAQMRDMELRDLEARISAICENVELDQTAR